MIVEAFALLGVATLTVGPARKLVRQHRSHRASLIGDRLREAFPPVENLAPFAPLLDQLDGSAPLPKSERN